MAHTFNTIRPHSSLGYRPPAPESMILKEAFDPLSKLVLNQVFHLDLTDGFVSNIQRLASPSTARWAAKQAEDEDCSQGANRNAQ